MGKQQNPSNDPEAERHEEPMSLSSALLAPINSIFEAQIHAARAFLNFILQMGFRHKLDPEEHAEEEYNEKLNEQQERKKEMRELFRKREREGTLSVDEIERLKELSAKYGDLYQQTMEFVDNNGNEFMLNIPNLALLPIKPLAIDEASFSYEFEVDIKKTRKYKQMGAALKTKEEDDEKDRPWFLIKEPKSIRGNFGTKREDSKSTSISIDVKVSNMQMPHGLEKLLVHLTNTMEAIDKKDD